MKAIRRHAGRLPALLLAAGAALAACTSTSPGVTTPIEVASSAAATIPAYYVALSHAPDTPAPDQAIVGDAVTGAVLARVSPPAGSTFAGVAGAGDDRTFVLDAQPFPQPLPPPRPPSESGQPWPYAPSEQAAMLPRTWYLLRLAPAAPAAPGRAALTRLPVPATPAGSVVTGMALSPDASKLAVSLQADPYHPGYRQSLRVYSVATGAVLRTWTTTQTAISAFDYGIDGNSAVTWLADGVHVAYLLFTAGPYLRTVDIRQPGGDLVKDAIKVVDHQIGCDQPGYGPTEGGGPEMVRLTPDGSALACAVGAEGNIYDHLPKPRTASYCRQATATEGLAIVSDITQKPVTNLAGYAEKGQCTPGEYPYPEITWTSPDDRELIGYLPYPGPGWALYRPGHATPLHIAAGINPHYVAW